MTSSKEPLPASPDALKLLAGKIEQVWAAARGRAYAGAGEMALGRQKVRMGFDDSAATAIITITDRSPTALRVLLFHDELTGAWMVRKEELRPGTEVDYADFAIMRDSYTYPIAEQLPMTREREACRRHGQGWDGIVPFEVRETELMGPMDGPTAASLTMGMDGLLSLPLQSV